MMIKINGLRVIKNGRTICSVAELAIAEGERVAILGPNGSGKTTLMRVLAGLETDYRGECLVNARRKDRVYVHQAPYLFRGTVLSNATYGLRARGVSRAVSDRWAMQWLERLGLGHLARHRVTYLSGGERRRLALARAMILQPPLLLLDEPLADMDETGAATVVSALEELRQSTLLVASPINVPQSLTSRAYQVKTVQENAQLAER